MPGLSFFVIAGTKNSKIDFSWLGMRLNCIQPLIIEEGLHKDKQIFLPSWATFQYKVTVEN